MMTDRFLVQLNRSIRLKERVAFASNQRLKEEGNQEKTLLQ
jgi:hypothetical protein